jgi:hypothetical protein
MSTTLKGSWHLQGFLIGCRPPSARHSTVTAKGELDYGIGRSHLCQERFARAGGRADRSSIDRQEKAMSEKARLLYASANGDRWFLVRSEAGRALIRHSANQPSGGNVEELDVGEFLIRGPRGPEHQELLRLIGSLAETR